MPAEKVWSEEQIDSYFQGIEHSEYPSVPWERMKQKIRGSDCSTLIDIGCGPGAFTIHTARRGYDVQAVDISNTNLKALEKRKKALNLSNIKTIYGDWLEVEVIPTEVSICAYCFCGSIGTLEGIKKVLQHTTRMAFFIAPWDRVQKDFLSGDLYQTTGIEPPVFENQDLLPLFQNMGQQVEVELLEYDFGLPLRGKSEINNCAVFLSDKLGIPDVKLVKDHILNHLTIKNGMFWVPNPRKSNLITWERRDLHVK